MLVLKSALTITLLLFPACAVSGGTATGAQAPAAAAPARKPAPKKPPPKRRAVYQVIDGMPPSYGPRLTPAPVTPAPGVVMPVTPGPAVISRCDAGGCIDTGGARYNGASGTLLSPQGRPCTSVAGVVTCN